jgi:hypothetical protein
MNWIKYSGVTVRLNLNPFHWAWIPGAGREFRGEWIGPNERGWYAKFLFVTVSVWIDDGSW